MEGFLIGPPCDHMTCDFQQPQKDLHFLLVTNSEYKSLLACFPDVMEVHKVKSVIFTVVEARVSHLNVSLQL